MRHIAVKVGVVLSTLQSYLPFMMSENHNNIELQSLAEETDPFIEDITDETSDWYYSNHDAFFYLLLLSTTFMIIWPWIAFAVIWNLGGIQLRYSAESFARNHSQLISFLVIFVAGIFNVIIVYLFSSAVASLAKKQVIHKNVTISRITFFIALRNRALPTSLFRQRRGSLFLMVVILYIILFTFITPGITVLLLPINFTRTIPLNGTELDFASNDASCINWFHNNTIPTSCDWKVNVRSLYVEATLRYRCLCLS